MINPAWFTPLGGLIGGSATAAAIYWARRKDRENKRWTDALIKDEILGHKNIPSVPDKKSMSERLGLVEVGLNEVRRELHPNGGASLADKIVETHKLAEQALAEQARVARALKTKENE